MNERCFVCIDLIFTGAERLSMDHRPSDASEARRVREEGGFITMGRLAGELAISRALGDLLLKNSGAGADFRWFLIGFDVFFHGFSWFLRVFNGF